jgi:hypothetical protein
VERRNGLGRRNRTRHQTRISSANTTHSEFLNGQTCRPVRKGRPFLPFSPLLTRCLLAFGRSSLDLSKRNRLPSAVRVIQHERRKRSPEPSSFTPRILGLLQLDRGSREKAAWSNSLEDSLTSNSRCPLTASACAQREPQRYPQVLAYRYDVRLRALSSQDRCPQPDICPLSVAELPRHASRRAFFVDSPRPAYLPRCLRRRPNFISRPRRMTDGIEQKDIHRRGGPHHTGRRICDRRRVLK